MVFKNKTKSKRRKKPTVHDRITEWHRKHHTQSGPALSVYIIYIHDSQRSQQSSALEIPKCAVCWMLEHQNREEKVAIHAPSYTPPSVSSISDYERLS